MHLEDILEQYPKTVTPKGDSKVTMRPLKSSDEKQFHQFFCEVPETERLLFKHRVTDPSVIQEWCRRNSYGKILPLLVLTDDKVIADASLHQSRGGAIRSRG